MPTKAEIIAVAKAAGVTQKAPDTTALKSHLQMCMATLGKLGIRGMGDQGSRPSDKVYSRDEIRMVEAQVRAVINDVRSLGIKTNQIEHAADWIHDVLETYGDATGKAAALKLLNAQKILNGVVQRDLRNLKSILTYAKALGVQKGGPRDLIGPIVQARTAVSQLGERGKTNKAPASTVYKQSEIYGVGKTARMLLEQAQNLPPDDYGNKRSVLNQLVQIAQVANNMVDRMGEPETTAREIAGAMRILAINYEVVIGSLKNHMRNSI